MTARTSPSMRDGSAGALRGALRALLGGARAGLADPPDATAAAAVAAVTAATPFALLLSTAGAVVAMLALDEPSLHAPLGWWLLGHAMVTLAVFARWSGARRRSAPALDAVRIRRVAVLALALALPWAMLALRFLPVVDVGRLVALLALLAAACAAGSLYFARLAMPTAAFVGPLAGAVSAAAASVGNAGLALAALLVGAAFVGLGVFGASLARERDGLADRLAHESAELEAASRRLDGIAHHDLATGLANRVALLEALAARLAQGVGSDPFGLVRFDIGRYSSLAARAGDACAESLMAALAARLEATLAPGDLAARDAVDGFAVAIASPEAAGGLTARVARMLATLGAPIAVGGDLVYPTVCAGAARAPLDAARAADLYARAGDALDRALCREGSGFAIYGPAMARGAGAADSVEAEIRAALADGRIEAHYQPKICLESGRVLGAEALVRLRRPLGGLVGPAAFLGVAEERGLAGAVSQAVFEAVFRDLKAFRALGVAPVRIAVNLHPDDLATPGRLARTMQAFHDAGFRGDAVQLEVTEDCAIGLGDAVAVHALEQIRAMGYELSLDDFGTGRASLSNLKRLPVSELKIDREFVMGLGQCAEDEAIVAAAIEMARRLGLRVIAEGVETEAQARALLGLGCVAAQGYLYAMAMPAADLAVFVRDRNGAAPDAYAQAAAAA